MLGLGARPMSIKLGFPATARKRVSEQLEVKDKSGPVAPESAVCSNIGINLVKDGGNAADTVCAKRLL